MSPAQMKPRRPTLTDSLDLRDAPMDVYALRRTTPGDVFREWPSLAPPLFPGTFRLGVQVHEGLNA